MAQVRWLILHLLQVWHILNGKLLCYEEEIKMVGNGELEWIVAQQASQDEQGGIREMPQWNLKRNQSPKWWEETLKTSCHYHRQDSRHVRVTRIDKDHYRRISKWKGHYTKRMHYEEVCLIEMPTKWSKTSPLWASPLVTKTVGGFNSHMKIP